MVEEKFNDSYVKQGYRIDMAGKVLGHTHVTFLEHDGKIRLAVGDGGGFWPEEMKKHMDNELVKLFRDFMYAVRKDTYKNLKADIREFDYEL